MARMDVHLVSPEREVWSGSAQMVVARGVEGAVGILPGHAPMLIRLAAAPLRIQREDGSWEELEVDGGFLHVATTDEGTRVDVLASGAQVAGAAGPDGAARGAAEADAAAAERGA